MAKSKSKGKGKLTSALDTELFAVDVAGDEGMRRSMLSSTWDSPAAAHPRKGSGKPLRSQEILAQRSKVPAQVSKATPGIMAAQKLERERRAKITPEMKRRLRGMVKRDHTVDRGLWDVAQEKQLHFLGGDVAVQAGGYDVWDTPSTSKQVAALEAVPEDIRDVVVKRTVKPPTSLREHSLLSNTSAIPRAVHAPHPGESYNPTMTDHQALLAAEHLKAVGEEETAARYTEQKEKVMRGQDGLEDPYATGYANEVGSGEEDSEAEAEAEGTEEGAQARKQRRRKTERAHRKKQANRLLEAQTRQKVRLSKAQRHAISSLSHIVGDIKASDTISLATLHKRKTQLAAKLAETGLAEFRSGPARVPKPKQHFLLSEELPESLRQLKTDGNLWSEWLDSSRRRGKVQMERRSFARMKKVRGRGLKNVEKATWRMFQV